MNQRNLRLYTLPILVLALLVTALPAVAERGDDTDRASKNGMAQGSVDGVDVTVEYGRPKVKEREIWGALVPYDKVWRTGADEATTVTFSQDVMVEGKALPAGTYALFTVPGEKEWTVIFNEQAEQWGAYDYDAGQNALEVTVTPRPHDMTEELTFLVEDGEVVMAWEKLAVPVKVTAG